MSQEKSAAMALPLCWSIHPHSTAQDLMHSQRVQARCGARCVSLETHTSGLSEAIPLISKQTRRCSPKIIRLCRTEHWRSCYHRGFSTLAQAQPPRPSVLRLKEMNGVGFDTFFAVNTKGRQSLAACISPKLRVFRQAETTTDNVPRLSDFAALRVISAVK